MFAFRFAESFTNVTAALAQSVDSPENLRTKKPATGGGIVNTAASPPLTIAFDRDESEPATTNDALSNC